MRILRHLVLVPAIVAAGCAAAPSYNIEYESLSSRLYVLDDSGALRQPLGGATLGIDRTVGLGPDAIRLAPGMHWISGIHCPAPTESVPDDSHELARIESPHGFSVGREFELGKSYLLRCVDGYPEIVPYEP